MDMDLDSALGRLAAEPLHPRLDQLENNVMLQIAAETRANAGVSLRPNLLAAIGAVALGIGGGGFSSSLANAQVPTLTPFGPSMPLAPSTLLAT